jgi:hypothetical protein
MKVGLFGDSYACLTLDKGTAWFENKIINEKYQLESYAKKGSDITWSYNLFLQHHSKYKKNIFIVTESTRHSFVVGPHTLHVSNIDTIDYISNQINDFKVKAALHSLKNHYMYSMSIDLYDFGLAGMVEKIKEIRPDTIIVYGFHNHSIEKIIGSNFYLSQVSLMELSAFNMNFDFMKKHNIPEGRSAHMSDENNQIFANYIRDMLDGQHYHISLKDFLIPNISDIKKYFSNIR